MTDEEKWMDIPGTSGEYQASSTGRIRSTDRSRIDRWGNPRDVPGKILSPWLRSNGYYAVGIPRGKGKTRKTATVHRLVLLAFYGDPPSKKHVAAHWNGVRTDNRIDNLRWATRSQNTADMFRHGTAPIGEKGPASKLTRDTILIIRSMVACNFSSLSKIAKMFGVTKGTIKDASTGRNWKHLPMPYGLKNER